jgi:hypothetical protein
LGQAKSRSVFGLSACAFLARSYVAYRGQVTEDRGQKGYLGRRRLAAPHLSILSLLLFSALCSRKPPQITYLAPLDRIQEGFLDPVTYQIVSYGRALDFPVPADAKVGYFPQAINETFDQEAFLSFNVEQQALIQARKPVTGIPLAEVLNAEANQLNPQEINLALIDEKIRAPMEVKRVLFDNACANARIVGLYRWLITDAVKMKLLHGAVIPREGLQETTLDVRYFPPRPYYSDESAEILRNLDAAMQKKKYRYEIVHEIFSKPEILECKVAIHIHRRNLQVNMPFLAPL